MPSVFQGEIMGPFCALVFITRYMQVVVLCFNCPLERITWETSGSMRMCPEKINQVVKDCPQSRQHLPTECGSGINTSQGRSSEWLCLCLHHHQHPPLLRCHHHHLRQTPDTSFLVICTLLYILTRNSPEIFQVFRPRLGLLRPSDSWAKQLPNSLFLHLQDANTHWSSLYHITQLIRKGECVCVRVYACVCTSVYICVSTIISLKVLQKENDIDFGIFSN